MSTDRATFCRDLAARIAGVTVDHPVRLGIDGVDAAGKTTLANALGAELIGLGRPIVRAYIDGFHRPRVERYRLGRHSPERYYRDSFQNDALIASLLGPRGPLDRARSRRPWRGRRFATAGRRPYTIRPISGTWQANASISRNVTRPILHPLWSTTRISPHRGSSPCGLR
jgi:uridine kinase